MQIFISGKSISFYFLENKKVSIVVHTAPTNTKRIAILFQQNSTAVGAG